MSDYKHTLNLPSTDFPMRGNLPAREPSRIAQWNDMNLYAKLREALEPGQWLIDQNNIVHRPLNGWVDSDDERWCEFQSRIPISGVMEVNHYDDINADGVWDDDDGAVTNLWYLPLEVEVQDGQGSRFVDVVPVYATVREL